MPARSLLRHIFRHGPRDKFSENALPPGFRKPITDIGGVVTKYTSRPGTCATSSDSAPPPKTPEPFGLENIDEEDDVDGSSSADTVSTAETLASLDLEISTFSTRELIHATLDEAKTAANAHLDTINTMLALLDALDGFSATISELRKEILVKKQGCDEKMAMLDVVERAVEGMVFAGEVQEQRAEHDHAESSYGTH